MITSLAIHEILMLSPKDKCFCNGRTQLYPPTAPSLRNLPLILPYVQTVEPNL